MASTIIKISSFLAYLSMTSLKDRCSLLVVLKTTWKHFFLMEKYKEKPSKKLDRLISMEYMKMEKKRRANWQPFNIFMRVNLKIINLMGMGHYFMNTEINIKDLSKMANIMVMECIYPMKILSIEDSSKTDSIMGWAVLSGETNAII